MKKILESLYDEYADKRDLYKEEKQRVYNNRKILQKSLNNYEKRLLLRITDDTDLIIEKTSIDSFINGFNVGVKLMLEILYCSDDSQGENYG